MSYDQSMLILIINVIRSSKAKIKCSKKITRYAAKNSVCLKIDRTHQITQCYSSVIARGHKTFMLRRDDLK